MSAAELLQQLHATRDADEAARFRAALVKAGAK